MIILIVAMDENGLIGKLDSSNGMPWKNAEELKHFKNRTLGHTLLMGKNTYLAIGKPLPNRKTIVLSNHYQSDEVEVRNDLNNIIAQYRQSNKDLFICGGASLYQQTIDLVDQLEISVIHGEYSGEVYFPAYDKSKFTLVEKIPYETFDKYIYRHC